MASTMRLSSPISLAVVISLTLIVGWSATHFNLNWSHHPGDIVDELNGVPIYFNGAIQHIDGRNVSADGYNLGLKWQCVEFVKRYYFVHLGHKMPEARGNAKDFFDAHLASGDLNKARGLIQFKNDGRSLPQVDDILIFRGWIFNPYGHVAIVSRIDRDSMEIVQQNPGPFGSSRERYRIDNTDNLAQIDSSRLLGWLRRPPMVSRQQT